MPQKRARADRTEGRHAGRQCSVGQSALYIAHLSNDLKKNVTKKSDNRQTVLLSPAADQIESGQVDSGVTRVSTARLCCMFI